MSSDEIKKILGCLLKVILAILNGAFVITGAMLLIVGVLLCNRAGLQVLIDWHAFDMLVEQFAGSPTPDAEVKATIVRVMSVAGAEVGKVLIALAVCLMSVSVAGCCGVLCGSRLMLSFYLTVEIIIVLAQLACAIILFSNPGLVTTTVRALMETNIQQYTGLPDSNLETSLQDMMHIYGGCCGVNNGTDFNFQLGSHRQWNRVHYLPELKRNVTIDYPASCCKHNLATLLLADKSCPGWHSPANSNYMRGCYPRIVHLVGQLMRATEFHRALAGILCIQAVLIASGLLIINLKTSTTRNRIHPV